MPAKTTEKGEIGEAMVIADLKRQGHDIAIPFGHNQPYDLIVIRKEHGQLEKVQVKYTTSDGRVVIVRIESSSAWVRHKYTPEEIDWVAVFEPTTGQCFYLPPSVWRGQCRVNLRLMAPANNQRTGIRFAQDFRVIG